MKKYGKKVAENMYKSAKAIKYILDAIKTLLDLIG